MLVKSIAIYITYNFIFRMSKNSLCNYVSINFNYYIARNFFNLKSTKKQPIIFFHSLITMFCVYIFILYNLIKNGFCMTIIMFEQNMKYDNNNFIMMYHRKIQFIKCFGWYFLHNNKNIASVKITSIYHTGIILSKYCV